MAEKSPALRWCPGPGHSPQDRSLSIKLDRDAPDGFVTYSHAGDDALKCKDYVRAKIGLEEWKPSRPNGSASDRKIVATYDYVDEHAALLFQVARFDPKDFRQRRPDGNGGWIWSLGEARRVLYRLPELLEAVATEKTIFIAEGEKAVDALVELGVPARAARTGPASGVTNIPSTSRAPMLSSFLTTMSLEISTVRAWRIADRHCSKCASVASA